MRVRLRLLSLFSRIKNPKPKQFCNSDYSPIFTPVLFNRVVLKTLRIFHMKIKDGDREHELGRYNVIKWFVCTVANGVSPNQVRNISYFLFFSVEGLLLLFLFFYNLLHYIAIICVHTDWHCLMFSDCLCVLCVYVVCSVGAIGKWLILMKLYLIFPFFGPKHISRQNQAKYFTWGRLGWDGRTRKKTIDMDHTCTDKCTTIIHQFCPYNIPPL